MGDGLMGLENAPGLMFDAWTLLGKGDPEVKNAPGRRSGVAKSFLPWVEFSQSWYVQRVVAHCMLRRGWHLGPRRRMERGRARLADDAALSW